METKQTCLDWESHEIAVGVRYAPFQDPCRQCTCDGDGKPTQCSSVLCKPPDCSYKKIEGECCKFWCPGELINTTYTNEDVGVVAHNGSNIGLRMIAAAITICFLVAIALFLIHVTKRKRRLRRQCRQQQQLYMQMGGQSHVFSSWAPSPNLHPFPATPPPPPALWAIHGNGQVPPPYSPASPKTGPPPPYTPTALYEREQMILRSISANERTGTLREAIHSVPLTDSTLSYAPSTLNASDTNNNTEDTSYTSSQNTGLLQQFEDDTVSQSSIALVSQSSTRVTDRSTNHDVISSDEVTRREANHPRASTNEESLLVGDSATDDSVGTPANDDRLENR